MDSFWDAFQPFLQSKTMKNKLIALLGLSFFIAPTAHAAGFSKHTIAGHLFSSEPIYSLGLANAVDGDLFSYLPNGDLDLGSIEGAIAAITNTDDGDPILIYSGSYTTADFGSIDYDGSSQRSFASVPTNFSLVIEGGLDTFANLSEPTELLKGYPTTSPAYLSYGDGYYYGFASAIFRDSFSIASSPSIIGAVNVRYLFQVEGSVDSQKSGFGLFSAKVANNSAEIFKDSNNVELQPEFGSLVFSTQSYNVPLDLPFPVFASLSALAPVFCDVDVQQQSANCDEPSFADFSRTATLEAIKVFDDSGNDITDQVTIYSESGSTYGGLVAGSRPVPEPTSLLGLVTLGIWGTLRLLYKRIT